MRQKVLSADDTTIQQRIANLEALVACCSDLQIPCWLSGRTHLYAKAIGSFPTDVFDSAGVRIDNAASRQAVCQALEKAGFMIRADAKWSLLVSRQQRQLEIVCYKPRANDLECMDIVVPGHHFDNFRVATLAGKTFSVPDGEDELIDMLYNTTGAQWFFSDIPQATSGAGNSASLRVLVKKLLAHLPAFIGNLLGTLHTRLNTRKITEGDFRALYFEEDAVNWELRRPHLALVTDSGKYRTVGEIIDYLKTPGTLEKLKQLAIDTPLEGKVLEPVYFNRKFWQSGNNFFFNCICYSFRKNVIPYEEINRHLDGGNAVYPFSADYYASLPEMQEDEIQAFLAHRPITTREGVILGGRHRVSAMIGRLVMNRPYLPVYATVIGG